MAIVDAIKEDPSFKKAKLTQKFERLPGPQKAAVLAFIKGKDKPEYELDDVGKQFTADPVFNEMLEAHKKEPPKRTYAGMKHADKIALMSGLMQIVRKYIGDPEDDDEREGKLKSEYAERTGGSSRMGSPFDHKFEAAYKSEGARGLARLHKNMLDKVEYQQFLDGV